NNVPKITQVVDKLLAIFPQEAKYFRDKNLDVTWVGHPLLDRLEQAPDRSQARQNLDIQPEEKIVTLLPASRQQEIKYLLPVMCQAAQQIARTLPEVKFIIPVSLPGYREAIEAAVNEYNLPAIILDGKETLEAIAAADLAISKSGTVNLEVALLNVPQVVIYRINPITAWIGRKLGFSVPLMSPPNLIVEQKIVPEFQQEEVTAENISTEALEILNSDERKEQIIADYQKMRSLLGEVGVCDRTATEIIDLALG
ncbi:MAG: lipid-A-disaccharide synthase, partial [Cyanobacteria bacterium P01_G01_bin.19]